MIACGTNEREKSITDVFRAKKITLCFTTLHVNQVDLLRLTSLALALTPSSLENYALVLFEGDR